MGTDSGQERRAIVVQDDEDIRALIEFTLTTQGFDVVAVDSGPAAVEAVREAQPDPVTLDLGLPASTASRPAGGSARSATRTS